MERFDKVIYRRRPWAISHAHKSDDDFCVGPTDATVVCLEKDERPRPDYAPLPGLRQRGTLCFELPLPVGQQDPLKNSGIPLRPPTGKEPVSAEEKNADRAMRRLEQTMTRVHELEIANDDPINIWGRLARLWHKAENETKPLVSEIVLQSLYMPRHLRDIMERLRRVLRRERAMVPIDRVQEMDQASMIWLTRQPGNTLPERAGPSQRVQAVVRDESHDTGENRVVHAWCKLADAAAKDWLRHNEHARVSQRYADVCRLRQVARTGNRDLAEYGVGIAAEDQLPNFVLTQDPDYREVYEAWRRLLNDKRRLDELWAWQGRIWSDFCALAITLAVRSIQGSRLVATSPVVLFPDHDRGAWFGADRPLAVYFLEKQQLVVEVQYRPKYVDKPRDAFAAPIWLRIGTLIGLDNPRRIPVWPRLVFSPVNLEHEANDCSENLANLAGQAFVYKALILHSEPTTGLAESASDTPKVTSIGIAPFGQPLLEGFTHIAQLILDEVTEREKGP